MISPNDFYADREHPTRNETKAMWDRIGPSVPSSRPSLWRGLERRSFVFGMAAAIVLMFATVGVYTTLRNAIEVAQPAAVQIDRAYQSAIDEFEKVAVRYDAASPATGATTDLAASRQEQLSILETAISALRSETNSHDISPLMRSRLRELYSKKLALLQVMVEQGDIML